MGRFPVTHYLLGMPLTFALLLALGVSGGTILAFGAGSHEPSIAALSRASVSSIPDRTVAPGLRPMRPTA